ncbi:MAG: DUF4870 domain-containing protein [Thainema sp.]
MTTSELTPSARIWSMICHLSALSLYLGIPFSNILVPFAIWSLKRAESPFVEQQGRDVVNFQLTVTLALLAVGILMLPLLGSPLFLLLAAMLIGGLIGNLVVVILGAIAAFKGEPYQYPLAIRFIDW